ncbi:MAG: hypothetical protein QME81_03875 [bacterium]|nr:hypothetical protein [bacterium]
MAETMTNAPIGATRNIRKERKVMSQKASRVIKYGNDLFRKIRYPNSNNTFKVTYWDLWIAIILVDKFDDDWDEMTDYLRCKTKEEHYLRDEGEALLNHIRLLRQTLSDVGLSIGDILVEIDINFLKKQATKAKRKILEMSFQPKEKSAWMINTPRRLLEARAMRGHWKCFPVNPQSYAGSLESLYKSSGFHSEDQSFALEKKLGDFINKHETRASHHNILALYRAFLTVLIEKMDMVDDSFGVIGDVYEEVFEKYFRLDRTKLDMSLSDFFLDLIELLIWEDYGGTDRYKPDFFAGLSSSEIPLVESILQEQRDELIKAELQYQAENALTMLGMLYVQHQLFNKFVPIAKAMGTREWKRITTMAEMAEKHQKYDLALAVYEACLGPGFHQDFLGKEYEELKSRLRPIRGAGGTI